MARVRSKWLFEAEELLEEVQSWSEEQIERLPPLYQKKAREYRRLAKEGDQ